jgi:hypothetical protein
MRSKKIYRALDRPWQARIRPRPSRVLTSKEATFCTRSTVSVRQQQGIAPARLDKNASRVLPFGVDFLKDPILTVIFALMQPGIRRSEHGSISIRHNRKTVHVVTH